MASAIKSASREDGKIKGRPTRYTEAIAAEICQRIGEGETLNQICRSEHMPARPTVVSWVIEDREGFSDRYTRAKDLQIEYWADEIVDVSDDASNDYMVRTGKDGDEGWVLNGEHIARSRLRVDSRKWLLSKLKPKKYGDKLGISGDGDGGPLNVQIIKFSDVDSDSG